MDDNKTIFDYIGQIMGTFGGIVLIFIAFVYGLGDMAKGYSSRFRLGGEGLSVNTLVQLFVMAVVLKCLEWLFLTPKFIKKMGLALRYVCFFAGCFIMIIVFCAVFKWFPMDYVGAWIGFIVSFVICTVISIGLSMARTKAENKKLEQALNRLNGED